jgi:hypothetical protein
VLNILREFLLTFLSCAVILGGERVFFHSKLANMQAEYNRVAAKQGAFINLPQESVQSDIQVNVQKLSDLKNIRTKSDVALILIKLTSLLPQGTWPTNYNVVYKQETGKEDSVVLNFSGYIVKDDPNEQIAAVNNMVVALKKDAKLSKFIKDVQLGSLQRVEINGRHFMKFAIHCS